ncbi:MAG TPA: excalibur calcium-binding domain-containing protein [Acidothermales bacterium]
MGDIDTRPVLRPQHSWDTSDHRTRPFRSKPAMVAYGAAAAALLLLPLIGSGTGQAAQAPGPLPTVTAPAPPQPTVTVTAPAAAELARREAELQQRSTQLDQREQAIGAREAEVQNAPVEEAPRAEAAPEPTDPPATSAYYDNCDAARAAGAAPMSVGDPGYRSGLDRDGDGIACE